MCILLFTGYRVGQWIEHTEQRGSRAALSAGKEALVGPGIGASNSDSTRNSNPEASLSLPAALPNWVQALRGTSLWTEPESGARAGAVTQWQTLKVVGAEKARFRVETVGPGVLQGEGWIDLSDVGLSGPPPDWVTATREAPLYTSADTAETVGVVPAGASLMVAGQPANHRLFVYLPTDPGSGRAGFGWIDADFITPGNAPPGLALPSPNFRTVPIGRAGGYRVQSGDSPASIAGALGLQPEELLRMNGLGPQARLLVGQSLQLPGSRGASAGPAPAPRRAREVSPGWIGAEHAVVVDGDSGQILWARQANASVAPASLTKIVTALVALDHTNLMDRVVVRVDSRRMLDSTVMGLYPGEELTVEDLLYGLMLPSGNDAAVALAEHISGTEEAFAQLMNDRVRTLGLTASHFVNPHGLDATGHLSSAYDMAMLAREGMQSPSFKALASARSYETRRGKGYQLANLNQLLWQYPEADGVKIGYTEAAGRAIVGSATRNGRRVFVAMMRSPDIYADSIALLDWAFAAHEW